MEVIAITQARYGSSRLPAKILKEINGKSLLRIHLQRVLKSKTISKLLVATTTEPQSKLIIEEANKVNVECYKGNLDDVLERFYFAAKPFTPNFVVRLTSDCPLNDPKVIDDVVTILQEGKYDYVATGLNPIYTFPDGISVEAFTFKALEQAYYEASLKSEREHVTPYIRKNSSLNGGKFKLYNHINNKDYSHFRLTVDEAEDFELIKILVSELGDDRDWIDYVTYIEQHPELFNLNNKYDRNEGYKKSILNDRIN